MADTQAVADAVQAGDYDDELGTLLTAVFRRAGLINMTVGWRLKFGDDEWTSESVGLQELAFAEKACSAGERRLSYGELDPVLYADHLSALLVAHLHHVRGFTIRGAFEQVQQLTVTDLADIVSVYEVKKAPKGGGGGTSKT